MHIWCFVGRFYGDFRLRDSYARALGGLEPFLSRAQLALGTLALGRFYGHLVLRRAALYGDFRLRGSDARAQEA